MATEEETLTITQAIQEAIRSSGLSRREIGRRAGVHHDVVARFVAGQRGIRGVAIDRLAEALNLHLVDKN